MEFLRQLPLFKFKLDNMKNKNAFTKLLMLLIIAFYLMSCQPDKKLIILQDVQLNNATSPLDLLLVSPAIGSEEFLTLDKVSKVDLYTKTNTQDILNKITKDNDDGKIVKESMNVLVGSRYYTKGLIKYESTVNDDFELNNIDIKEYDFVLNVDSHCNLPYGFDSKGKLKEVWRIKNTKENSIYKIELPQANLVGALKVNENFRELYVKQIHDFISTGKIGKDFIKENENQ
jgi:hypothetical protein